MMSVKKFCFFVLIGRGHGQNCPFNFKMALSFFLQCKDIGDNVLAAHVPLNKVAPFINNIPAKASMLLSMNLL